MSDNQNQKTVFCMNCGGKNDASDAYCIHCGAKLHDDNQPIAEATPDVAQSQATPNFPMPEDMLAPESPGDEAFGSETELLDYMMAQEQLQKDQDAHDNQPQVTQAMPVPQQGQAQQQGQVIPPMAPQQASTEQPPKKSSGSTVALVVAILALIAAVAVGVILIFKIPIGPKANNTSAPAATEAQKPKEEAQADAKQKEQDDQASKQPETGSYDEALAIWRKCGDINDNITKLAKEFNGTWERGVVPTGHAQAIIQDINDLRSQLQELRGTDYGKQHKQTMEDLNRLIEDLSHRVNMIYDACVAVTQGASKDQVLNILSRDVVDGHNKYRVDFADNYESLRPKE